MSISQSDNGALVSQLNAVLFFCYLKSVFTGSSLEESESQNLNI